MFEMMPLHLTPNTRAAMLRLLKVRGERRTLNAVVDEILLGWLQQVAIADPQATQAALRGYQWRSLFLPEGTCVRFEYKHRVYLAQVCGDQLMYQDQSYSPRQLLLHLTGTVRNAWRELWLRCPGDARWHLADTRRHILRRTPQGRHHRGIDTPDNDAAMPSMAPPETTPSPSAAAPVGATRSMAATPVPASPADALQSTAAREEAGARSKAVRRSAQHPAWRTEPWPLPPPAALPAPASLPAPSASTTRPCFGTGPSRSRIAALRAYLYRDDLVRDDQPDLSCRTGGGGRVHAGRSGPRDRRYTSYVSEMMAAAVAARCAQAPA